MEYIADNVRDIRQRIEAAAERAGRKAGDITLVGVTKTIDVPQIQALVAAGVNVLGENKVQELLDKYPQIENVKWHLIGHLQTNKAKYVIDKAEMIHSVDSIRLSQEINARAEQKNMTKDILLEINIANEQSKYGIVPEDAVEIAQKIAEFTNLRIRGLMCVAPFVEKQEENRYYFAKMKQLLVDITAKINDNRYIDCLSMGMTNDYEVAIEEGATMVRIGTGIFGARDYK